MAALFQIKSAKAQSLQTDVVKIMAYNVGDYGASTNGCPELALSIKNPYIRTVLKYASPDILACEKMKDNTANVTTNFINNVLDSVCNGCYGYSTYTNVHNASRVNMLYYNTNKFGFVNTTTIYSADPNISDINLHKLYYKSMDLATTHDSIFLCFVVVHLVSGSDSSASRGVQMTGVMSWLNAHVTSPENLFIMGDFNTVSSSEPCYQAAIASTDTNTLFFDPPNQLGQWTSFPATFANYLTQSTRTTDPGDCLATGGIFNRFDHILCNGTVKNGYNSVKYIPGSYTVIGQDGQHTGHALIDAPANTSVPGYVDTALYYTSEHLPVSLNVGITYTVYAGIEEISQARDLDIKYNNIATTTVNIFPVRSSIPDFLTNCEVAVYDLQGRMISNHTVNLNQRNTIDVSSLAQGMYLLRIMKNGTPFYNGKLVKE